MVGELDPVGRYADDGIEDYADDVELVRVPGAGHFLPEEVPGPRARAPAGVPRRGRSPRAPPYAADSSRTAAG